MRRYNTMQVTNKDSKSYNKFAVTYKANGNQWIHSAHDTKAEAQEHCLIAQLKEHQYEMDKITRKLANEYSWERWNETAQKYIGNILA